MHWLFLKKAHEIVRKPEACSRPCYLQLEATTHCNLACYMCVRNEVIKRPQHLLFEDFRRAFDQIKPPRLTLSGAGEPLLNPDLMRMVDYANRHGAATMIPTNGTLLVRPGLTEGIVQAGVRTLKISIDAATAQTYAAIRRQDCFDTIIAGIERIAALKKERGHRFPEIRFDVVILKENYAEIPDIIRLARRLNVRAVFFRALQATGIRGPREDEIGQDMDWDALYRAVQGGIAESAHRDVRSNLQDVAHDFQAYRRLYVQHDASLSRQVCLLPWLQCFVSVGGELSPCCATYRNEGFSAGNIFAAEFDAVWNGPRMQSIRRQFRNRKNPFAVCRDCLPRSLPVLLHMSSMLPGFIFRRPSFLPRRGGPSA
jgi:MoaA/NifB/PqqE/SkfB family radical SAM enzyme